MPKRYKLTVNVPLTHADRVREAIAAAGAGRSAKYSHCSFSVRGVGRFTPGTGAHPFLGSAGKAEAVEEEQIQVDVFHEDMINVLKALKESHPYEEIGYDIHEIMDDSSFL